MSTQPLPRQPILERLRFIEFRALWDGRVNRRDLTDAFGISEPQASLDLRRYQELDTGAMLYDARLKAYVPVPGFQPQLLPEFPAEHYLNQLLTLGIADTTPGSTWLSDAPPAEVLPRGRKRISTDVLRGLLSAMRAGQRIRIRYQSLSTVESEERWIAPYAFVNDGHRWHARAWCPKRSQFLDFVLSRMLSAGATEPADVDPKDDMEWQTYVTLHIAPHPGLEAHQKRAVELDYNMSAGIAQVTTRACLYRYLEWSLRLDLPEAPAPRWRMEVVLRNREQVEERCRLARELTQQRWLSRLQH